MPYRVAPCLSRLRSKTSQGEHPRGRQVARPVLVVNRERFGRFTRDMRRAPADAEKLAPVLGRLGISPPAPREKRERTERCHFDVAA
jgi:hypothetical protein